MTDLRREVLGLILDAEAPTGAYDLLDQLKATRHGAAPPTVYRALEFLLDQGLIHKVERLSAYVGCVAHEAIATAEKVGAGKKRAAVAAAVLPVGRGGGGEGLVAAEAEEARAEEDVPMAEAVVIISAAPQATV